MADQYSTSAALRFTEMELGGPCTETTTNVVIGASQDNIIAQQNPDRVGLIIMNISSADCYVNLVYSAAVGSGIYLNGFGGLVTMNVRDDFTLPSREWHANCAAPTILLVMEIVRFKAGDYQA